jgi:hypothetical protein
MPLRIAAKRGAAVWKASNASTVSNGLLKRNAAQARTASSSTNLPEDVKREIYVTNTLLHNFVNTLLTTII